MHPPPFALAVLIYASSIAWASGAPAMSAITEAALQARQETLAIRWRHRWSRDYEWSGRRSSEGGETVLGAENPLSMLEGLNRDTRRRRGWIDPPPPE